MKTFNLAGTTASRVVQGFGQDAAITGGAPSLTHTMGLLQKE